MSQITIELIKEFREKTGVSAMQCKRALEEADGDFNKALAILKKTSSDIALKKSDRETKDGAVIIKSANDKMAMLVLNCETDFVAKSEDFTSLLPNLVEKILSDGIEKTKEDAKNLINPVIQKTGENIQVGEVYLLEGNSLGGYVHSNKIGVMVSLEGGNSEIAKDIAMHVAAMKPEYIFPEEITEENKKIMLEIFEKEVAAINKPEEIKKKMLAGKIESYFKEKTLMNQPFIKNPNETIAQLLEKAKAKIKEIKRIAI
ncbi:MAG: translation elongation factor Ts [Patescibacteria group bacterium]